MFYIFQNYLSKLRIDLDLYAWGDRMTKKVNNIGNVVEEIKIPMKYVDEIDRIIGTGMSIYPSRDEFIKSAVQIHLNNTNGSKQ
jgi:hypothetical protein